MEIQTQPIVDSAGDGAVFNLIVQRESSRPTSFGV